MKVFPVENFILNTTLSKQTIIERLHEHVEPTKPYRIGILDNSETKPYEGEIDKDSFSLRRITIFKNIYLPQIKGAFQLNDNAGGDIILKMSLRPIAKIFIVIFYGKI